MISQVIANNINPRLSLNIQSDQLAESQVSKILQLRESPLRSNANLPELSWLNTIQNIGSNFSSELKRISFFELLDQTPTIRQLFSKDYVDLVDNLVSIQENSSPYSDKYQRLMTLENDKLALEDDSFVFPTILDGFTSEKPNHDRTFLDKTLTSDFAVLGASSPQQGQTDPNSSYNHLLYQQSTAPQNKQQPNTRQALANPRYPTQDPTPKPYSDKKKDKNSGGLSRQLIKSTVRLLNKTAEQLSKFAQ